MSRTIIAPILGLIFLVIKSTTGIEFGDDLQAQIVDAAVTVSSLGVVVYGIWKNHFDKNKNKRV